MTRKLWEIFKDIQKRKTVQGCAYSEYIYNSKKVKFSIFKTCGCGSGSLDIACLGFIINIC